MERIADFAVTQLAFNPIGTYLAASSVANSISLVPLDPELAKPWFVIIWVKENQFLLLGIIMLVVVILYVQRW